MKPGDIVRLAPNIFNDPETRHYKMLVLDTYTRPKRQEDMVVCLVDGVAKHFRQSELDVLVRS